MNDGDEEISTNPELVLPRHVPDITMAHTIRHHIPSKQLYKRLGIAPVDQYYHRRLLHWAGHVSRMPMTRASRQLLTGWVAHPGPPAAHQ